MRYSYSLLVWLVVKVKIRGNFTSAAIERGNGEEMETPQILQLRLRMTAHSFHSSE
jgi:hypothetical protein